VLKGDNPWDLRPGTLWQMNVTHIPSFRQQCYVHVSVDTYTGYIYVSANTSVATKLVIAHCWLPSLPWVNPNSSRLTMVLHIF
jgi:hypothetical protein